MEKNNITDKGEQINNNNEINNNINNKTIEEETPTPNGGIKRDILTQENNINEINNINNNTIEETTPTPNGEIKRDILINDNSEYQLNLFYLINIINSNKNDPSKKIENEYILNLLLMSTKLNKSNKVVCLLLLFFINQEDKKNIFFTNYLFNKISKLMLTQTQNKSLENYILLKESSYLINQNNIFYSKEYLFKIKNLLTKVDTDKALMTTIDNLFLNINKNIKSYLDNKKNQFLNRAIMNDNRLNYLKNVIEGLAAEKYEITENTPLYLINKDWVFKTKLFILPYIEARKENIENLLLEDSFDIDKVYYYFMDKQENGTLKNYFGIVFPGPINNYGMLDFKDHWVDPINLEENNIIKDDLVLNKDFLYISQKDWNFLKEIFDFTNEITRKKKNQFLYKIKVIIFEPRLGKKMNKHLLRKRIIQIDSDSNIKDFKNKIIRCLNYEICKDVKFDEQIYEENEVLFYLVNKQNKDILIEIVCSFVNNNKIYEKLYIKQIKFNSNEETIKNLFNYYNKSEYLLIAEIIPKNNTNFIKLISPVPEINNLNIYNCSICGEQLNLKEKYNCDLCNLSLFCCYECAKISGEHNNLHLSLNKIYNKKFKIESFINEKLEIPKDCSNGIIGLDRDKNNSCINSILQCLSNTLDLTKYFLINLYTNDINISDFLTKKETFVIKYYDLIKEMWLSNKINKNLDVCHKDFVRLLIKNLKIDINDIIKMHDIQRILNFLLNNLHKELNRYVNIENIDENNIKYSLTNMIEPYLKRDNSIITDLYQGISESILSCSKCGNISMIYEPFNIINLPIPKKNNNIIIKYFNDFECKYMKYILEENSTIKDLKDKAINYISEKINHIIHIMSLTELIEVASFDSNTDNEKLLTYIAIYNSIELVQFDKNKIITKVYDTSIEPENEDKDNSDVKKSEYNNELNLQISKIYKENNDIELVFYEKSVIDEICINIYIYPFIYNEKDKLNKNRDKMFNSYPIAISASLSLILENFEYLVNVRLRDLLIEHFKTESEKRKFNYIELVIPHYFNNSSYYSGAICPICNEKRKNSLFCPLISDKNKDKTIKDLILLFKYPEQPIFFLAKCKYYDPKKQIYSNISSFSIKNNNKKVKEKKLDIYDCFELYTKKESIYGMDFPCEQCKSIQIPQRQKLIYKPPLYLIIQLERITTNLRGSYFKNNYIVDETLIDFPINNLDIREYVEGPEKNKAKYNLYGIIDREISSRNDNIYSICKNKNKWIMYKDNKLVGTNSLINKNVNYLFYRREDLP